MTTTTQPFADFDSSTADASLGTAVRTDNDRPPLGSYTFGPAYDGTCFIIKGNLLYYCRPKQPEAWPPTYYIEVGPPQLPGKLGLFHNGQPYYLNANQIWYIQGTGAGVFNPVPMNARTGAQSSMGAVSVEGRGIYHTGPDGIYLYSNGNDRKITEDSLEPIFRGESVNDVPGVASMSSSILFARKNHLYFAYADSDDDYPTNIIVMNLINDKTAYYIYNDGSDIEVRCFAEDVANSRILVGDNTGFIRTIENTAYTDDSGTAISWEIQSKDYTMQTRAHFPRWVKYDVDASSATSVTGDLLLDGASHQTHTISGARNTKRRLIGTGNGERAAIKLTGTGPVTVYSVEFE